MSRGDSKPREYLQDVDVDKRLRVHIDLKNGRPVFIAVSLELQPVENDWKCVARIDNAGGTLHIDIYKPDGAYEAHRRKLFDTNDLNAGIRWAKSYLINHAERLVTNFRAHL